MNSDDRDILLRIAGIVLVLVALGAFVVWAQAQDDAAHKGCRKLEGSFGGKYGYVWDCPPSGGK